MRPAILWPMFVVGIAFTSLSGAAWLVYAARSDPSFAVEPRYYDKAVRWDETARLRERSSALGWRIDLAQPAFDRLTVRLVDREGRAVRGASVECETFANACAGARRIVKFHDAGNGEYAAAFEPDRAGLWHFRFTASRGSDSFAHETDRALESRRAGGEP